MDTFGAASVVDLGTASTGTPRTGLGRVQRGNIFPALCTVHITLDLVYDWIMLKGTNAMKITKVQVHERHYPKGSSYPNGRNKPAPRQDIREYHEPTRVYVQPSDYSVMEHLVNRRNRPWKAWKPLVQAELADAGYTGRVRWSQYAGCKMCPCSPGFVIDRVLMDEVTHAPIDVWITVSE